MYMAMTQPWKDPEQIVNDFHLNTVGLLITRSRVRMCACVFAPHTLTSTSLRLMNNEKYESDPAALEAPNSSLDLLEQTRNARIKLILLQVSVSVSESLSLEALSQSLRLRPGLTFWVSDHYLSLFMKWCWAYFHFLWHEMPCASSIPAITLYSCKFWWTAIPFLWIESKKGFGAKYHW